MGRKERELKPGGGPVVEFARELRALRERAGNLTYESIARRSGRSTTSLSEAAGGNRLPSLEVALAYAEACGAGDEERSHLMALWSQVRDGVEGSRIGKAPVDPHGGTVMITAVRRAPDRRVVDPASAQDPAQYVEQMWNLWAWAKCPSFRELADKLEGEHGLYTGRGVKLRLPKSTLSDTLATTDKLPRWDIVLAFIYACGAIGARPRWEEAWQRIAIDQNRTRSGRWRRTGQTRPSTDPVPASARVDPHPQHSGRQAPLDVEGPTGFGLLPDERIETAPAALSARQLRDLNAQPLRDDDPVRIGSFPLLGVLGSGGMGRVYLGHRDDGYAAVKQVLPFLAEDQVFLRHFAQELDNQSRLPAGVSARLLAADPTARPPWFASEYVAGVTLHDAIRLSGGSLPVEAAWLLLRELAGRLETLAGMEMMHRDIKPSNVMLTREGARLIDFGVARAADQSTVTASGLIVGTPAYMAPEQARAAKGLTPALDVFCLASVIAFAVTGEPPFGAGSGTDLLYRIVYEDPDLHALEGLDPELAKLVTACLAKDPHTRPPAAAVAEAARARASGGLPRWPAPVAEKIAARRDIAESVAATKPEIPKPDLDMPPAA